MTGACSAGCGTGNRFIGPARPAATARCPLSGPGAAVRCLLPVLAALVLVTACGGGGGRAGSGPGCINTTTGCIEPEVYGESRSRIAQEHSGRKDFRSQWGLSRIRADRAWAQLELALGTGTAPGAGQTIGVIDSGIDKQHPVFAGKRVTEEFIGSATNEDGSGFSHGTAVASVIAAKRDAVFPYPNASPARGVAWGSDIAMFALTINSGGGRYAPVSPGTLRGDDSFWSSLFNRVTGWSSGGRTLDFVNLSINYSGIIDQYGTPGLRDSLGRTIAALAQAGVSDKTVFVWSAGNAHGDSCLASDFTANPELCVNVVAGQGQVNARSVSVMAGLPARIAELRQNMVSVVAVGPDGSIASFSNRCGIAAQWCLAAPGVDVRVAYFGPYNGVDAQRRTGTSSGTSYAAPMVTGALAVVKQFFRGRLSNTQVLSRVLSTADRTGRYANSAIYGRGLLDLAAATSPVGASTVSLGTHVDGPGVDAAGTGFFLGRALGDGLVQSFAGIEMVVFDELDAPFWHSLGGFARSTDGPSGWQRLHRFMARRTGGTPGHGNPVYDAVPRFALLDDPSSGIGAGHLSLADRGLSLDLPSYGGVRIMAFSTEGQDGQDPVSGGLFSWRPAGAALGLKGGWAGERETLLGSRPGGAFGAMASDVVFAGIEGSARVGAWRLAGSAEVGQARPAVGGGLIADLSRLTTSTVSLQAERAVDAGTLLFALSQPLRVESGSVRLSVPVDRTRDGRVVRRMVSSGVAPTGREIEVSTQWHRALGPGGELRLGAALARHPGHDRSAAPGLTLLAGLRYVF